MGPRQVTAQESTGNMGNGAKAATRRERGAKDAKKGPTSQLKTVRAVLTSHGPPAPTRANTCPCLSAERGGQDDPVPDLQAHFHEQHDGQPTRAPRREQARQEARRLLPGK